MCAHTRVHAYMYVYVCLCTYTYRQTKQPHTHTKILVCVLKIVDTRCPVTYFHYYHHFDPGRHGTPSSYVTEDKLDPLISLSTLPRC